MQIKTKLNFSFATLVISLVLTGFIGIRATQEISKNHLVTEKITDLLFTQNKMISITSEVIASSDLTQLQELKDKFNELTQSFHIIHTEIENFSTSKLHDELSSNEKNLEVSGNNIFKIHANKLNQQIIFTTNYPIEKTQRGRIRTLIFNLKVSQLTQQMGDAQYYSKETLYQHRDQEHLDKWIDKIEAVKTLILPLKSTTLSQAAKEQVLNISLLKSINLSLQGKKMSS